MTIKIFTHDEWQRLGPQAHTLLFGEDRPPEMSTEHFVIGVEKDGELGGYVTCLRMDAKTLYWQFGGVLPPFQKTIYATFGYIKLLAWTKEHYDRVWTRIENTNVAMIKLDLKMGFLINGVYHSQGKTFLELTNEFR